MNKFLAAAFAVVVAFFIGILLFTPKQTVLQAAPGQGTVYTTSGGFTAATTTINTTSTQVFASINQLVFITNSSTATLTCSLDGRGTTAVSSTVTAGRGVIIGPSSGSNIPAQASFGNCSQGDRNCYPHTGAVNCLASATTSITTLVQ